MDNLLYGQIVRADNDAGIANLNVTIFDIDSAILELIQSQFGGDRSVSELFDFKSASSSSETIQQILALIFGPAQEEDGELRGDAPAGDRLGSVLTDQAGKFELSFSDEVFNDERKEKRPDLLLIAFGPDVSVDLGGSGFGLPQTHRIVHFSLMPRWNAGRQEAFFIKIPESLFEKAGLRKISRLEVLSTAERLKKDLEAQKKESEEIRKVRKEFAAEDIKKEVSLNNKSEVVVQKILNNISTQSDKPYFLSGGLPARERAMQREIAITEAQKTGINNLANIGLPSLDNTVQPRPLPLFVPESILFPFFPDWSTVPNPSYTVTVDTACGLINLTAGGRQLVRSQTLRSLIDRNKPAEDNETLDEIPGDDVDEEQEVTPDLLELTAQQRIQMLIEQQISDVVISQPVDPNLPPSTLARLSTDLDNAIITPGPADTTSFHDFHTLQIAFENVWTEALSSASKERIKYIYSRVVKANEYFDDVIDPVVLEELSSMEELMESGLKVADVEDSDIGPYAVPSDDVLYYLPKIRTIWKDIGLSGRLEIEHFCSTIYIAELGATRPTMILRAYKFDESLIFLESIKNKQNGAQELLDSLYGQKVVSSRLRRLLGELSKMLGEDYKFEHFEKDTINYGVISTYRQTWEPGAYQVGSLVKTVPLAPGETRSFSTKQTRKTSRARKEIEKNEFANSFDSTSTSRLDTEIVRRAEEATNFSTSTTGNFNFKIGSISNTTSFQNDQKRHSQDTKKSFREAIIKTAEEVKSEHSLEVNITDDYEFSSKESGELKNPNNELTVTYLLYELERQYKISEKIHALTPVVMVAQEMPAPDDITESWLLRYDWILKRALLDQAFMLPIDMLRKDFVSNEVSINLKKANWQTQLSIVENLQGETSNLLAEKRKLHELLITAEYNTDRAEALENSGGFLHRIAKAITPFDPAGLLTGNSEAVVNQAKSLLEVAEKEFANAAEKLANSREALNSAVKEYSSAVESITQRRTLIDQLRIHIKDNILHYMQAIWSYEPNDQRYFRLYRKRTFFPQQSSTTLTVRRAEPSDVNGMQIPGVPGSNVVIEGLGVPEWREEWGSIHRPLHEVADLDKPLGFKGNYMLFPLKECNLITDFMMSEYVDGYFGVRDPDALSEFSNGELAEHGKVLKQKADQLRGIGDITGADAKDAEANIVTSIIGQRLDSTHRDVDEISLPTGQLYMEALVGKNTLLEPFKLAHRGYDALSAREELRKKGLENSRYAAKMLADIPKFDDPEVDTYVRIDGENNVNVEIDS